MPTKTPLQELSAEQQLSYQLLKKSALKAHILWLLAFGLGAHYFYLETPRNIERGRLRLLFMCTIIGSLLSMFLCLADLFLLYGRVQQYNQKVMQEIVNSANT